MRIHPALALLALLALAAAVGLGWQIVMAAAELPCGARPDHERVAQLVAAAGAAQLAAGLLLAVPLAGHLMQREPKRPRQRAALARVRARGR
jgi:Na+/serine symporter